jgi:anti-anti-sigma factor
MAAHITTGAESGGPSSNPLLVDVVSNATCLVIRFMGELDERSAEKAEDAALGLLARSSAPLVELDLADVTFCGSCGLAVLIRISMAALAAGRHAVIRRPRPIVRRMIDVLDLQEILTVED